MSHLAGKQPAGDWATLSHDKETQRRRRGGPAAEESNTKVWGCRALEDPAQMSQMVARGTTAVPRGIVLMPHSFISMDCQHLRAKKVWHKSGFQVFLKYFKAQQHTAPISPS